MGIMETCMGKSITSIYIFFLFFSFCFSQSTEEVAEKTRLATVTVFRNTSIGTGFSIQTNKGPFIITNYHVVNSSGPIYVSNVDSKKEYTAKLKYYNRSKDLAVLEIERKSFFKNYLKIETSNPKIGSKVYACGNTSGGAYGTFTEGIISGFKNMGGNYNVIQHTAPISLGNSGGPLVNENGFLIGVNTWVANSAENGSIFNQSSGINETMGFATKSSSLISFLNQKNIKVKNNFNEYISVENLPEDSADENINYYQENNSPKKNNINRILSISFVSILVFSMMAYLIYERKKRKLHISKIGKKTNMNKVKRNDSPVYKKGNPYGSQ